MQYVLLLYHSTERQQYCSLVLLIQQLSHLYCKYYDSIVPSMLEYRQENLTLHQHHPLWIVRNGREHPAVR